MYICIYNVYIYTYRERERERDPLPSPRRSIAGGRWGKEARRTASDVLPDAAKGAIDSLQ